MEKRLVGIISVSVPREYRGFRTKREADCYRMLKSQQGYKTRMRKTNSPELPYCVISEPIVEKERKGECQVFDIMDYRS